MSWQDRPYNHADSDSVYGGPAGGGLRSWIGGGMPAPGKVVKWLLIANIGMFILCKITGGSQSVIFQSLALRVSDAIGRGQIWRLLTYSYLHSQESITHILFNMIGLYFLGVPLEARWGPRKLFVFYTIGSIVACALYVPLSLAGVISPDASLVGASGGIMALLGACAVLFPTMQVILILFPVPIRFVCVLFVVLFSWNAFSHGDGGDACHLAGLAFGIYFGYRGERWFGFVERWNTRRGQRQWDVKRQQAIKLESDVDRILEKVRVQGIQSLTRGEKRTLENATKAKQAADRARREW